MERAIQIRSVPEDVHRKLKMRAAAEGMSLSEMLLRELRLIAARPTRAEVLGRVEARTREALDPSPADAVREEREGR